MRYKLLIFRSLWSFLLLLSIGNIFFCSENNNPIIENRIIESAPVSGLSFLPHRKYITSMDTNFIQLNSFNKIYECSKINSFTLNIMADTVSPAISLTLPEELDKCGTAAPTDSAIPVMSEDWEKKSGKIYLSNSTMKVTDSAVLTEMDHGKVISYRNSNVNADRLTNDSTYTLAYILENEIQLECGDSLSYAGYCLRGDTLFINMVMTSGWDVTDCDSLYNYQPKNEIKYFQLLSKDPDSGCGYILDSLGYGN